MIMGSRGDLLRISVEILDWYPEAVCPLDLCSHPCRDTGRIQRDGFTFRERNSVERYRESALVWVGVFHEKVRGELSSAPGDRVGAKRPGPLRVWPRRTRNRGRYRPRAGTRSRRVAYSRLLI